MLRLPSIEPRPMRVVAPRFSLSAGLVLALGACNGDDDAPPDDSADARVETSCTNNQDDDVDGTIDCDDADCASDPVCLAPDNETACEDGIDEDLDSLTDCDDPDCDAELTCVWPQEIQVDIEAALTAYGEVECQITSDTSIAYFFDSCVTSASTRLPKAASDLGCTSCDRVYAGPVKSTSDGCAATLGDGVRFVPSSLTVGLVFSSDTERALWAFDEEAGAWTEATTLTRDANAWVSIDTEELLLELPDCLNSPLAIGSLTMTVQVTDP